jgi:Zn-dependent protease
MKQQFGPLLYKISIWALPAIIAITFHEAAHGFVRRFGDDTAWQLGRVTFNPLKHIDPMGTIVLPAFLHSCFSCIRRFCLAMRSQSRSTSRRSAIRGGTWCG